MKKYIIISIVLVILVALWIALAFSAGTREGGLSGPGVALEATSEAPVPPSEVTAGVLDDGSATSAAKLLVERLKELGFKSEIVAGTLSDLEEAKSETSFRLRANADPKFATVKRLAFKPALFRAEYTEEQKHDVIVSAWNVDDVLWGDLKDDAQALVPDDPANLTMTVLNAGAEAGDAARLAQKIGQQGYANVEAKNAEAITQQASALIYYQRNFREAAKKLLSYLKKEGYADASYRFRADQETSLVVVLGSATSTPSGT